VVLEEILADHDLRVGVAAVRQTLKSLLAGPQRMGAEIALRLGRRCGDGRRSG
jgi:hypothetical protein